jgi:H/ACA ribonucleoprotein complex subunit 4
MNIAILSLKGELIAIGIAGLSSNQIMEADHGIVAQVDTVLMGPGTYPAWWTYKKNRTSKN